VSELRSSVVHSPVHNWVQRWFDETGEPSVSVTARELFTRWQTTKPPQIRHGAGDGASDQAERPIDFSLVAAGGRWPLRVSTNWRADFGTERLNQGGRRARPQVTLTQPEAQPTDAHGGPALYSSGGPAVHRRRWHRLPSAVTSIDTTRWLPAQRRHRRSTVEADLVVHLVDRSRTIETRQVRRVDRTYRAERIESNEAVVMSRRSPGRPTIRPTPAVTPIDIDRLDDELWRRFEKRARIDRERRGRT
jgi:hypothetical protein